MNKVKRLEVRYAWIEASLRYSGHFDKVSYGQNYSINAPQISADQAEFVRAFNFELSYRERKSGTQTVTPYLSVEKGKISILRKLPDEPVFDVPGLRDWLRTLTTVSFVETLQFCAVDPDPDIFREICSLIMREKPTRICYKSDQGPSDAFNISPHSILDANGRLFVRAFDHGSEKYRDFLMSAIVSVSRHDRGISYRTAEFDKDWHEEIDIPIPLLINGAQGACPTRNERQMGPIENKGGIVSVPRAVSRYLDEKPLEDV